MKWQQREYSPQQMQQMQQEALERVLWLLYSDHCTDNTLMLALLYLFL